MFKKVLYSLILISCINICSGNVKDSLRLKLDFAIQHKADYAALKDKRTSKIRKAIKEKNSPEAEYLLNQKLYTEYRKYKIDSALYFITKNVKLSDSLKQSSFKTDAVLQLANLYSASGRFLESEKLLKSIDTETLSNNQKKTYLEFYIEFFEHYATNNPSKYYNEQIGIYRDSLLAILDPQSSEYKVNLALRSIDNKDYAAAKKNLEDLFYNQELKKSQYAMCAYLLGNISMRNKKYEQGIDYYTLAAITDIETATKDQGAIQNLAIYNYYNDKIDLAYKYAKSALEDAVFCNVKFRTLMMSEFYSIINAAYQKKAEKNKKQLQIYIVSVSVLSCFLIVLIFYVYRQMRRLSRIKKELSESAQELQELNSEFQAANDQLKVFNEQLNESNNIKEEYIAQFFDICSSYINKMEDYRIKLYKKAISRQFVDLTNVLKSNDIIDQELYDLYRKFDAVFIKLYPEFTTDFNALLAEGEKITLKEGEILTTELRIFALERLGIKDSEKIASFLRLSMSTIYNYRTKIRNKTTYSKEEFTKKLEKTGSRFHSL
ncbi:DUF6377 domain-containing protein [Flavobacterium pectinovorum]|uniref:DUF6377 domain-containing protein n=1 Tax=Flavobacterium pectinovorum TaxID=29533 RepID=A0A502EAT6_9FLAO|nr:DUF6377 domain-containing protein [Flavobacterium pectinovorum]TPG34835.1 hypothetical protein EAH81_22440 [Flavobacterium pectinovorum]